MSETNIIRRILDTTGWTQAEMGRRIGIHKDTIQDWLQGRTRPRPGVYVDLHRILTEMQMEIDLITEDLKVHGSAE
ncbi:helix-turn-helix domain-containing protein [Xanthobacter autotrophicus]|uniref:helix-turn-helix domain-containing protein n=1 Tax=Xanthobacter autotrophicus TaxID=280 RepID=UPI00372768D0